MSSQRGKNILEAKDARDSAGGQALPQVSDDDTSSPDQAREAESDDAEHAQNALHRQAEMRHDPDAIRRIFENGEYPYKNKISTRAYEKHKAELQIELLKVQEWVKATGQKLVLIFEGRDAAGKGGTTKRFMEHLNPRGARVVALDKPSERERTQWFFQRYIPPLPSGGGIVLLTDPGTTGQAWNA